MNWNETRHRAANTVQAAIGALHAAGEEDLSRQLASDMEALFVHAAGEASR